MSDPANPSPPATKDRRPKTREELVQRVTERVWQLWREDLRRERERRGREARG